MTQRCVMYVDGYNFYYSIKRNKETPIHLGWTDFQKLAERSMIGTDAQLLAVKYFTAPVGHYGSTGGEYGSEAARQQTWLAAVRSIPATEVIEGFHTGDRSAAATNVSRSRKEKQTDVNIAVTMVVDAARNAFDRALLITSDQDEIPAVHAVTQTFGKAVDIWLPPNQDASRWRILAAMKGVRVRAITKEMLSDARLPERIEYAGEVIETPKMWRAPAGSRGTEPSGRAR